MVSLAWTPTIAFDFVYDDHHVVANNHWLDSWSNLWPLLTTEKANTGVDWVPFPLWRPLRNLSYLIDVTIAGKSPWWFHLVNVMWHLVGAFGVFALARRLGLSPDGALLAAGFFALHPVQAESVAWVKERDGLMSTAFLLWSLWFALGRDKATMLTSLVLFGCAVLTKENCIVYPALIAGAAILFPELLPRCRALWLVGVGGLIGLAFLYGRHLVLGQLAQVSGGPLGGSRAATFWTMNEVWLRYAQIVVMPSSVELRYDWITPQSGPTAASVGGLMLVLAMVGAALWSWMRGDRLIAFGLGFTLVTMLPYTNAVPMMQWMAARFLYLPLVGLGVVLAVGMERLLADRTMPGRDVQLLSILPIPIMLALALAAQAASWHWSSDLALWGHNHLLRPDHYQYAMTYADELNKRGRYDEAVEVLAPWLGQERPYPAAPMLWRASVEALEGVGEIELARNYARRAVELMPRDGSLLVLLGRLESEAGNHLGAAIAWERAVAIRAHHRKLIGELAKAHVELGNLDRAAELRERLALLDSRPAVEWDSVISRTSQHIPTF
jgi:Flp pilus assembly protein TadD